MKCIARRTVLGVMAAILCSCSFFDYSVTPKRYALVYGVSAYWYPLDVNTHPDYNPNLYYPHMDAAEVAAMLAEQGYTVKARWVDDSGYVYVDGAQRASITVDASEAPSKSVITADLASLTDDIGADDQFLFYFSGHGMQAGSSEYIVPFGAIVEEKYGGYAYYFGDMDASIAGSEMGTLLSTHILSSRKIVILDTCNSGGIIDNGLEVDITPSSTDSDVIIIPSINTYIQAVQNYASFSSWSTDGVSPYNASVLSASGADESSWEDEEHQHGAMTYYLLFAPVSADLTGDGRVTVREAFSYVKAGIEGTWNKTHPSKAFTPHVSGGPVDWVLF